MAIRIDDYLNVSNGKDKDYHYTSDQVIAVMQGAATSRTSYPCSYFGNPGQIVYFTALNTDLTVRTARTNAGVTEVTPGLYRYQQPVTGSLEFIAVWDEGDPTVFADELIVVAP